VRSTDPSFVELVDALLHPYRRPRPDEDEPPGMSADCGVTKEIPGMPLRRKLTLYFGTIAIYRGFSFHEMAGRMIGFVRDGATRFRDEFLRLHAGSVAVDGGVILMPGAPDPRLQALSAALVARGGSLLGDDLTLLEPVDRLVHPLGLPLLVESGLASNMFPGTAPLPPRRLRGRQPPVPWTVPIRPVDVGGGSAVEPAPLRWVVLPEFRDDGPPSLEPIAASMAVFATSRSVLNWHIWQERALILIRELLTTVPVARLVASSIDEGADRLIASLPDPATS
jgi:hypothetical protein